jgi:hypothetical protein
MEESIIKILKDAGGVGVALALVWVLYKFIAVLNRHTEVVTKVNSLLDGLIATTAEHNRESREWHAQYCEDINAMKNKVWAKRDTA